MAKMGNVWDRTTAFTGERFGVLVPVALLAFALPGVVSTCLQVASVTSGQGVRMGSGLAALLLSVVSIWGALVVIGLATGAPGLPAAGQRAMRRLPATLLVSIGLGLAMAVLVLPFPLILAARGYDVLAIAAGKAGNVVVDPQTSSMVALYLLVLVPVLLVVFARLILVTPVVLCEPMLFGAIRRSWALTRRHGWRILGMLLLFGLIGGIAQLAAQTVFGSVFTLLLGAGPGVTPALVLTAIITASVQAVMILLLTVFQGKLYDALALEGAMPA